jgi:hypothetical protein
VIPLPDKSLLEPEREPDCTFKGPPSTPTTAEEMRMKLDYEQQCYRQSGSITRERMKRPTAVISALELGLLRRSHRTSVARVSISGSCHKRTNAPQQIHLLDHVVGNREQRRRHDKI